MKSFKTAAIAASLVVALIAPACKKTGTTPSGAKSSDDSVAIAHVNQTTISAAEFKKQIEDLAPQVQQALASDPKARKEFVDDLIGIELVIQEAKRQGLDKDKDFVKRQDMLKKEMERRIQEDAKNDLFNTLLKKELGDKLTKIPATTDQEVKDYYEKNKDKIVSSTGKQIGLKEVEPQLKMRITQEKRRDLYLEYAKALKAKAQISVDEKALETAASSLTPTKDLDLSSLTVSTAPKKDGAKK